MFTISGIRGISTGLVCGLCEIWNSEEMTQKAEDDSNAEGWNHPEVSSLICAEIHPGCPLGPQLGLLTGSSRALSSVTTWASSQRGS